MNSRSPIAFRISKLNHL